MKFLKNFVVIVRSGPCTQNCIQRACNWKIILELEIMIMGTYQYSYVYRWEIFWIDQGWPPPQRARFWCARTLLHNDDEVVSKKKRFLTCAFFFDQRVILSRLCIPSFGGFFRDFSVFRRSKHAWMAGILVTCVNSDESAQSAHCARSPRHMLSHHFLYLS